MFGFRLVIFLGVTCALTSLSLAKGAFQDSFEASAASTLAGLDPEALEELTRRGVVLLDRDSDDGDIEALVVFSKSVDQTWELLSQVDRQGEYSPELKKVLTIEKGENHVIEQHQLKVMFVKLTYRIHFELDRDQGHIHWELDPTFDNDVEEVSGDWWLFEMENGGTLGLFGATVHMGGALPHWLEETISRKKIPENLRRTRDWVDRDGQ